jgi:hypothetical protein
MKSPLTHHHIVPKSRDGSNMNHNIKMLRDNVHKSFHCIFQNDTPVEQLWNLTFRINYTALSNEFTDDIRRILSEPDPDYYYRK